jgi:hypothetical protein
MAMTKAEKAAFEDLLTNAALRWPMFECPAHMTHDEIAAAEKVTFVPRDTSIHRSRSVVVAWFCNAYTGEVTKGWIENHLYQPNDPQMVGWGASRFEGVKAYRTEDEAWRAMRWETSKMAAKKLREIDLKNPALREKGE